MRAISCFIVTLLLASFAFSEEATVLARGLRSGVRATSAEYPSSWYTHATATDATATATRAATTGAALYLTKAIARCDSGSALAIFRVLEGVNVVIQHTTAALELVVYDFDPPYRVPNDTLVSADIGACGVGIVGRVTVMGYTLEFN